MRQRNSDQGDRITPDEAKAARKSRLKMAGMFFSNMPVMAKIAVLLAGLYGGSIAAPEVLDRLAALNDEPLAIPAGETVVPAVVGINPQVRQSLVSHKSAIDNNGAQIDAIRAEIQELEERREAASERDDASLDKRMIELEEYHD